MNSLFIACSTVSSWLELKPGKKNVALILAKDAAHLSLFLSSIVEYYAVLSGVQPPPHGHEILEWYTRFTFLLIHKILFMNHFIRRYEELSLKAKVYSSERHLLKSNLSNFEVYSFLPQFHLFHEFTKLLAIRDQQIIDYVRVSSMMVDGW